jgi:hypothetical protein
VGLPTKPIEKSKMEGDCPAGVPAETLGEVRCTMLTATFMVLTLDAAPHEQECVVSFRLQPKYTPKSV